MRQVLLAVVLVMLGLSPAVSESTASDPAAQQISRFYDALLEGMKGGKSLGTQGRYRRLEPVIEQTFDLPTMTKLAVGPSWSTFSQTDQQALIRAFGRMTIADYAKNFDSYDNQQFVVDPNVQTRGEDKVVNSKMVSGKSSTPFNYRMRQSGGGWKIVDIYLNGYVSELATKRSDFATTISSGGATALTAKLNTLADNLLKEG